MMDCDNLESVIFEDTNGWYITTTKGDNSGDFIDVTNPSLNAQNLKTTYREYYWYKSK